MFIGQYETKISHKKRVAIPKNFRKDLGNEIIVAKWYEGSLTAVKKENWLDLLEKLIGSSKLITTPVRVTERFIMGSAFELKPDSQGRVVLPDALVEFANLDETVVFVGVGNRVEIWNKNNWENQNEIISNNAAEMIDKLASESKDN